tara:strand:- start:235 stop:801 length:567 start_codon:yes stop_codon:yes gene_type:complete
MGKLIGSVGLAPGSDEGTDLTTKGDLHGYSTSNTRIPIGSDNQVLTADSAQALGLKWASAGGGASVSTQTTTPTNGQTTTSATFVDVTNASITLPTRTNGFAFISAFASIHGSSANTNIAIGIYHNGSLQETQTMRCADSLNEYPVSVTAMQALDGSVVKMQWKRNTGTATMVDTSILSSRLQTFEVS